MKVTLHQSMAADLMGDANLSVFYKVQQHVAYPGNFQIKKMDCINYGVGGLTR